MIFVTGGTGLVGAHLLYHLLDKGERVKALKRPNSNLDKTKRIFLFYTKDISSLFDQIEWVNGDLLDYDSLCDSLQGVTKVYHAGALVTFNPSLRNEMKRVNEEGTANLVNACLEKKIVKLCFVSSIATLGDSKIMQMVDENSPWQGGENHSLYSLSKFRAEMEVWRGTKEGLDAVIVNPSVILGPGDFTSGSLKIFDSIKKGLRFYIKGGTGFVDVRDVVNAMYLLMESDLVNQRFVINSENLLFRELFAQIATNMGVIAPRLKAGNLLLALAWRFEMFKYRILGIDPLITKDSARTSKKVNCYSGDRIKSVLSFEYIPIEATIQDAVRFYQKGD